MTIPARWRTRTRSRSELALILRREGIDHAALFGSTLLVQSGTRTLYVFHRSTLESPLTDSTMADHA